MKTLSVSVALALTGFVGTTTRVQATSTTDVAWIAGGASILVPTAVQAVTGSKLEVKVEVYRETADLCLPSPDGQYWRTVKGSAPYVFQGNLALRRAQAGFEDPVKTPNGAAMSTVAEALGSADEELSRSLAGLATFVTFLGDGALDPSRAKLRNEATARRKALNDLHEAVVEFRRAVATALTDGKFDDTELAAAANQLRALRIRTEQVPRDISPLMADYFVLSASAILQGLVANGKLLDEPPADTDTKAAELDAATTPNGVGSQLSQLQDLVWRSVAVVRKAERDGKIVDEERKVRATDHIAPTKAALVDLARKIGFLVEGESDLFGTDSPAEFKLIWDTEQVYRVAGRALDSTYRATFAGITVSANFGPIANEVIQGLLAQNRYIDDITSNPDRWATFNLARSRGGAGTHNAVVYFENMLTPVLKSASFDPSQLLLANAQIYKRATNVLAQVYGAPTSQDVASDGDSLNLMRLEARKRAAVSDQGEKEEQIRDVLKQLVAEHEAVTQLKADTGDGWKDAKAAKEYLEKLSARLSALSTKLDTP